MLKSNKVQRDLRVGRFHDGAMYPVSMYGFFTDCLFECSLCLSHICLSTRECKHGYYRYYSTIIYDVIESLEVWPEGCSYRPKF